MWHFGVSCAWRDWLAYIFIENNLKHLNIKRNSLIDVNDGIFCYQMWNDYYNSDLLSVLHIVYIHFNLKEMRMILRGLRKIYIVLL